MTGFGAGRARGGGMVVDVELGCVNRKTFDVRITLPSEMRSLDADLRRLIGERITRGSVSCVFTVSLSKSVRLGTVEIDEPLAAEYVKLIKKTAVRLDLKPDLSADLLLRLPDVLKPGLPDIDREKMLTVAARALATALRRLDSMRKHEGAVLQKDIVMRLATLEKLASSIRGRVSLAVERYREELSNRVASAGVDVAVDKERLWREVVMFADRMDITEELTRIASHFEQACGMFKSREPAGRALEFLAQELLREINTIASKSRDAKISVAAIEFKSELERIREQIRNIE